MRTIGFEGGRIVRIRNLLLLSLVLPLGQAEVQSVTFRPSRVDTETAPQFLKGCVDGKLSLPEGVTFLARDCFLNHKELTEVSLPSTMRYAMKAFDGCTGLRKVTFAKDAPLQSLKGTFDGCSALEEVILPEKTKEIGFAAFRGCKNLTKLTFPKGLELLGIDACKGTSLKEATLHSSVWHIGKGAFLETPLETVEMPICWEDDIKNVLPNSTKSITLLPPPVQTCLYAENSEPFPHLTRSI